MAGLPARELASSLIGAVLIRRRAFDDALAATYADDSHAGLQPKDRALARLIAATVLRRLGQLESLLETFIARPPQKDADLLGPILLAAVAQLVFLKMPAHAVINIAVEQCRRGQRTVRFAGLANAVLRRIAERGQEMASAQDAVRLNIPEWMWARWGHAYGEATARRIAEASLREAPLDISAKKDAAEWAQRLGGRLLPTDSIRRVSEGRVEDLPGFGDGAWWVQDAAAALPARLLGPVAGLKILDLCAAPGGKTAELAASGANVTAVEVGGQRLERLRANLERLNLKAHLIEADAATWAPGVHYDAALLDAPCLATGTIRRHPDILRLKRPSDLARIAELQGRLLANAMQLVRPGGLLVYCTCSLEPEEGPEQVARGLAMSSGWDRVPVQPGEAGIDPSWITNVGELRTLPYHMSLEPDEFSGMDGFYAARLIRRL